MAGKKVTIMVGFIPLRTRIEVAVDDEASGTRTICTGDGTHDPVRVKMHVDCPACERSHSSVFGFPERGVEQGDKIVVLTQEQIAQAKGEPRTGRDGKALPQIAFHNREKVFAATVAGDSVQNVYPDKGGEQAYMLLRDTLAARPHLVATMIWAPTTANALWVLEVVGDRIVASKRSWPEYVRAPQQIPAADVTEAERLMFEQFVDASVEDFDLSIYSDRARLGLTELIAQQADSGVPLVDTGAASQNASDLLAALQASLAAAGAKPVAVKAPAKKRATKKAPAKKAASRKPKEAAA